MSMNEKPFDELVHPHRCGEIRGRTQRGYSIEGSPPQVWGNRRLEALEGRISRFTPTGVGKSSEPKFDPTRNEVHPHRCGEILEVRFIPYLINGSPPQVWGNRLLRSSDTSFSRFTPTGVGKSSIVSAYTTLTMVHPHRCGEIISLCCRVFRLIGSPPQVWGNRAPFRPACMPVMVHPHRCGEIFAHAFAMRIKARFTPTGVGKSRLVLKACKPFEVHPHRCGEIIIPTQCRTVSTGSPPQVWGNRSRWSDWNKPFRFTPTGVGKSPKQKLTVCRLLVHPHRCGEILIRHALMPTNGSPPQVWGNPYPAQLAAYAHRFTPTGVGKSMILRGIGSANKVHPHRCGEIFVVLYKIFNGYGSPPQVWGNHSGRQRYHG